MKNSNDKNVEHEDMQTESDSVGNENVPVTTYKTDENGLYKMTDTGDIRIANFHLEICSQKVKIDEGIALDRYLDLALNIKDQTIDFTVSVDDFSNGNLMNRIYDAAGSAPILYGSVKDLRIGTQELSPKDIPIKTISTSTGHTPEGNFLYPGMLITPEGINTEPDIEVDLTGGNLSRNIGFLNYHRPKIPNLAKHLLDDFLALKNHVTMYPLIGHIVLSPFCSWIASESGKQKPALHLSGPSGGGKTFLASLAASFTGQFEGNVLSWTSTANSIEMEGHNFRDTLFVVDDYKAGIVEQSKITRVIQNHANNHGRSRLNSKSELMKAPYIRGLLLSTGEDFISGVESVSGRTILLEVDPEQNSAAGMSCMNRRNEYRMFLPALIEWLISDPTWKETFKRFIDERTEVFHKKASGISNGLRIVSNWALNALGFDLFIRFIRVVGIIDEANRKVLLAEYYKIVLNHLAEHALKLQSQNPVEAFFSIIGQKIATGAVVISDLMDITAVRSSGKLIGKVKTTSNLVCIFPDIAIEHIVRHYRAIGQRASFTKDTLKDALVREGLIVRPATGRVTTQVRLSGDRLQAWQFNADEFKLRCGLTEEDDSNNKQ